MIFIGNFQPFCSVVYCCSSIWNQVFSTSGDLNSNVGDLAFSSLFETGADTLSKPHYYIGSLCNYIYSICKCESVTV